MDLYKEYVHKTKNALVVSDGKGFLVYTVHDDHIFIHDVYSKVFVSLNGFIEMIRKQLAGYQYDYRSIKFLKGSVPKISLCCDDTLKVYRFYKFEIIETNESYEVKRGIEWAI